MEPTSQPKPFISVPEWGREYFDPPLGRARAYALAHQLGIATRLGQRKLVIARRAADELAAPAVQRARAAAEAHATDG